VQSNDNAESLLADLAEYVLPLLAPYPFSLYVLLLKWAHIDRDTGVVRVGLRTIGAGLGKSTRASYSNWQHVNKQLQELEAAGFIVIGDDKNREGTEYKVHLPRDVPAVAKLVTAPVPPAEMDYFKDPALRAEIFDRDGWSCHYCGECLSADVATLDHVVPQSKGGPGTPENLVTCCLMCNSIKSGRTEEEAAPELWARIRQQRANG